MLYLAEVSKKTGFMGVKTEIKLLARQQSDQNWVALPGDELIATDAANDYASGVLVLVELGPNNQLKGIEEATRQLISILKNFSKMKEKFVNQEEEIEGWKQSLIYQSQELTRREVDMESRAEELSQWESESQKMAQQRQEFEETKIQIVELKEQLERDRQQLEEGWGKLQLSQRELEEVQSRHSAALSDSQVEHIESLLNQLEAAHSNGNLGLTLEAFETRLVQAQQSLEEDRQRLDELNQQVKQHESTVVQNRQKLDDSYQQLLTKRIATSTMQAQLEEQKSLQHQLKEQEMFYDSLGESLNQVQVALVGEMSFEMSELWEISPDELQERVNKLSQELTKLQSFVADQEEELSYQLVSVDEMRQKMELASEYERLTLQSELEEEEQHYQLLNETLEGQRKSLQDRVNTLSTHETVLEQRNNSEQGQEKSLLPDLSPTLLKFHDHCDSHRIMLSDVDAKVQSLITARSTQESECRELEENVRVLKETLALQEQSLNQQKLNLGICQGKVEVYQAFLHPMEEQISILRGLASGASEQDDRMPIIAELKHTLMTLGEMSEAVSLN